MDTTYDTVITNGHLRELVAWTDLPDSARGEFADYIGEDYHQTRFVQYRGTWYDVNDCQRITAAPQYEPFGFNVREGSPLIGWDAIQTESVWTGVVFRFPTEEEAYRYDVDRWDYIIVGRYVA